MQCSSYKELNAHKNNISQPKITIIRYYPKIQQIRQYQNRYNKKTLGKYKKLIVNVNFQKNLQKWKSGINHKTDR